jgi:Pvc16 N-terminal domain/Carboxypeptidase regulatory-like domain
VTSLRALDEVLRRLFLGLRTLKVTPATNVVPGQIGFQPPEGEWRRHVGSVKKALNVYLVDLRENRMLRSNERVERVENGVAFREPAPVRVNAHYLVTAWSAAEESVGKTLEEHEILGEALAVLIGAVPLVPRAVFGAAGVPTAVSAALGDDELPTVVVPPEGFPKHAEFWGTLKGDVNPWKPAIYLQVTVPVLVERQFDGLLVTTRFTDYRQEGQENGELLVQIGGLVRHGTTPVGGAWVELRHPAGALVATTTADARGRFTFLGVSPGAYDLHVGAPGLGPVTEPIDVPATRPILVPAPLGPYDVDV